MLLELRIALNSFKPSIVCFYSVFILSYVMPLIDVGIVFLYAMVFLCDVV